MVRGWILGALALLLAACTVQLSPPIDGVLSVDGAAITIDNLPPGEMRQYRIDVEQTGTIRVQAVPEAVPQASQLELTVFNRDFVPLAKAVSRYWFGIPQVTLLGITPTPIDAYRINLKVQAGDVFFVRVANRGTLAERVEVSVASFTPRSDRSDGGTLRDGVPVTGAIEFLGEFDTYTIDPNLPSGRFLHLDYSGPIDLVAFVFASTDTGEPPLAVLEPQKNNCVPVQAGTFVLVRDRSSGSTVEGPGARAGFDEPGSGQYTLSLLGSCPVP
ncbi:hypothetical protein Marky_2081 [Marinithermus hydrothermalis DSM 14884]|uniref:Lipoprotein n=1 Tax=Marinithermus hydrothermalis (strain DSM 14884 / JCM 11576 / T1) TaxID=869210 RepID=F2NN67_MARHT|nr:hypothetical protein Marky_2081 [Marinithermus hydrothermalis DSM 14884]